MTISKLFEKKYPQDGTIPEWAKELAIEYAKYHVGEALKVADEIVEDAAKSNSWLETNGILTCYPDSYLK